MSAQNTMRKLIASSSRESSEARGRADAEAEGDRLLRLKYMGERTLGQMVARGDVAGLVAARQAMNELPGQNNNKHEGRLEVSLQRDIEAYKRTAGEERQEGGARRLSVSQQSALVRVLAQFEACAREAPDVFLLLVTSIGSHRDLQVCAPFVVVCNSSMLIMSRRH